MVTDYGLIDAFGSEETALAEYDLVLTVSEDDFQKLLIRDDLHSHLF